jgi:hypothetical protein
MNTIEDLIRTVIREELERVLKPKPQTLPAGTAIKVKSLKPEDVIEAQKAYIQATGETMKVASDIQDTTALLAWVRDYCKGKDNAGPTVKAMVNALGYEKISAIPDGLAPEMYIEIKKQLEEIYE